MIDPTYPTPHREDHGCVDALCTCKSPEREPEPADEPGTVVRLPGPEDAALIVNALRARAVDLRRLAAVQPSPPQITPAMFGSLGAQALAQLIEAGRQAVAGEAQDLDELADLLDEQRPEAGS